MVWTLSNCGPLANGETVKILQDTLDDYGRMLGITTMNKGRVTYTMTNLDWSMYPWPTDDIVFMAFMGYGVNGSEVNWHILGNRYSGDGQIETRIVSQRFDGVCIPYSIQYCEKRTYAMDNPKFDSSKSYKWDCSWDTSADSMLGEYSGTTGTGDGLVSCSITDVTDTANPVYITTLTVPTSGPLPTLRFFIAGGNSSGEFRKTNMPVTMTNFRFSVME